MPHVPFLLGLVGFEVSGEVTADELKVTGVPAGEVAIGQSGSVILRKIATRAGIPDYGYAFWPGRTADGPKA